MSYAPVPPGGYNPPVQYAGQNQRPATVSIASALLYITAALLVLSTAIMIFTVSSLSREDFIDAVMEQPNMTESVADATVTFTVALLWVLAVLYVVIAVVIVLCGIYVARGKQWARVTSWVFAGLSTLCCGGFGLLGGAASGLGGGADQDAMNEALAGDVPAWLSGMNSYAFPALWLLTGLAIIILLALPPSNAFFRKPEPVWTPPTYPQV